MQNFSIPTFYAIRYYCMKCNWGQIKSLPCIWTDLHTEHTWSSHSFFKVKDPLPSPLVTLSVLFCQCLLSDVTDALFLAPLSRYFFLSLCFEGPKAVFGLRTAAHTWFSEAELIMWVTSQLRLMVRENCHLLLWQTVDQSPKQRWSFWDGCSGHLRNFCGVTPCASWGWWGRRHCCRGWGSSWTCWQSNP